MPFVPGRNIDLILPLASPLLSSVLLADIIPFAVVSQQTQRPPPVELEKKKQPTPRNQQRMPNRLPRKMPNGNKEPKANQKRTTRQKKQLLLLPRKPSSNVSRRKKKTHYLMSRRLLLKLEPRRLLLQRRMNSDLELLQVVQVHLVV